MFRRKAILLFRARYFRKILKTTRRKVYSYIFIKLWGIKSIATENSEKLLEDTYSVEIQSQDIIVIDWLHVSAKHSMSDDIIISQQLVWDSPINKAKNGPKWMWHTFSWRQMRKVKKLFASLILNIFFCNFQTIILTDMWFL